MPLAYRASTSANPNPMISPAFLEANYEILESLLRERRKQIRNEELRTELEYFSKEYDEEWEMEPRPEKIRETTPPLRMKSPIFHSILNYEDLKAKFRSHFSQQKKFTKTHLAVHNIKQREGESTRDFATRYTDDTLQILGLHEDQLISGFVHGLRTRNLVEFLSIDLPSTYKGLMEKTCTWIEAREVTTNGTLNDRRESFERSKKTSWDNNKGQKSRDRLSPYRGPNHRLLSKLSKSPREILATEKVTKSFEQPPRMFGNKRSRDMTKYCHFHKDHRHNTNDCRQLRNQIKEAVKLGQLSHLVKGIKQEIAKASDTQREKGRRKRE
ncbi:reverse transcriptase domain-containing protein [Tanacetum coccineum]